jgi:hypothetical protein
MFAAPWGLKKLFFPTRGGGNLREMEFCGEQFCGRR